jgi:hypothetical protein
VRSEGHSFLLFLFRIAQTKYSYGNPISRRGVVVRVAGHKRPLQEMKVAMLPSAGTHNAPVDESKDKYFPKNGDHLPLRATRRRTQDSNGTKYLGGEAHQPRNSLQEIIHSRLSDQPEDVPRTIFQVPPDDRGRFRNGWHSSEISLPYYHHPQSDPPTAFIGGSFRSGGSVPQLTTDWTPQKDDFYPFSSCGDQYDLPTVPTAPIIRYYQPFSVEPTSPSPYAGLSSDNHRPIATPMPVTFSPKYDPYSYNHTDRIETPTVRSDPSPQRINRIHPIASFPNPTDGFDRGMRQNTFDRFDYNHSQNYQSPYSTDYARSTTRIMNNVDNVQNGDTSFHYPHEVLSVGYHYDDVSTNFRIQQLPNYSNGCSVRTVEESWQLGRPPVDDEEATEWQEYTNRKTPDEVVYPGKATIFRQMSDITSVSSHHANRASRVLQSIDKSNQDGNDWPRSWNNSEAVSTRSRARIGMPYTRQQMYSSTISSNDYGMNENTILEENREQGDQLDFQSPLPPRYGQEHQHHRQQLRPSVEVGYFDENNSDKLELDRMMVFHRHNSPPIPRALFAASPETGETKYFPPQQEYRNNQEQRYQSTEQGSSGERGFWDSI